MRTPNEVPILIKKLELDLCDGFSNHPHYVARIKRFAGLSVWATLAKPPVQMNEDTLTLLFKTACWLALVRPSKRSRKEVEARRAQALKIADVLDREALCFALRDPETEKCLRRASEVFKKKAADMAGKGVERRRDVQGHFCCSTLSGICFVHALLRGWKQGLLYLGAHLDKQVAIIANAVLDRNDIDERAVRYWRKRDLPSWQTAVKRPKIAV